MSIFSEKTLTALYNAGWTPEREIDISSEVQVLRNENYPVFPVVLDFLKRYGRLEVSFQRVFKETTYIGKGILHFEIERALKPFRRETFEAYCQDLGMVLCPIGITSGSILWTMNSDGRVYGIYEDILFIGDSGEAAIENYSSWHPDNLFPVVLHYNRK